MEAVSAAKLEAVARAVAGDIGVAYQPVADLKAKKVFGYEALARPQSAEFVGPLDLFQTAARLRRVGELGRTFRKLAIRHCPEFPLFFNIYPSEFDEGYLVRTDDPIFGHRPGAYLEIVETVPQSHFKQCHGVLEEIRARGCLLAIDNVGVGSSNLSLISELNPAVVKIDRQLIKGVRHDTRPFRLLRALIHLCHEIGARVVVEGVETVGELAMIEAAGADFCQGFILARPSFPPPEIPRSSFF